MSKMSAQERRRTLQQQLYQQIHEEQIKKEKLEEKQQMSNGNKKGDEQQQQHQSNLVSPLKMKISKPKNNKKSSEEKNNSTVDTVMVDIHEASHEVEQSNDKPNESYRQPCSAFCPGRRNMLPNLLCSRCFCLFHLECVSDGIFLEEPKNLFICPVSSNTRFVSFTDLFFRAVSPVKTKTETNLPRLKEIRNINNCLNRRDWRK